jgi:mono/diheme cytochrome c family protein
MKHTRLLFLISLAITLLLVTACAGLETIEAKSEAVVESSDDEHMDDDDHAAEDEHGAGEGNMDHLHVEAPDEFAALANPFADDHEAIEAGEETFNTLCATCHGEEGKGDGPGAAELDPKPADLSDSMMMSDLSDGYLLWRVSKGGAMEPWNSAMPAWESGLTEEQRWQVISFIRTFSENHDAMEGAHVEDEHADDGHTEDEHTEDEHDE